MNSATVLDYFKEITAIPRESGHEEPMTAYLQSFAASHNLECKTDEIGNVMIAKPASAGKENVPTIVLQAHQDMVCEKLAGVQFDFATEPIRYEIENGWMVAKNTTLGADDGIGVAACLALLVSDVPTGRVECVFTISEETGMDGAFAMKEGFFTGKTLINLDSEDEGQLFIGCAGGMDTTSVFEYDTVVCNPSYTKLKVTIDGGLGGHSGDDINKGRANTVQLMGKFLAGEQKSGLQIFFMKGGNKRNAIARDCTATIAVPNAGETETRLKAFAANVRREYAETDGGLRFNIEKSYVNEKVMDPKVSEQLVKALATCPHGVIAMCKDIPNLVETSTNLAAVKMSEKGKVVVLTSQRSSIKEDCRKAGETVAKVFADCGAIVEQGGEYPGWAPNINSNILNVCEESYKRLFGQQPLVLAIHAGLECGLFLEKFPGLDMISFGPTLRGVHAPGEKLELASLDKFVDLLVDVVCNFK